MMRSPPFQSLNTAAMALNNMGVALLERARHSESIKAFGEALGLMRELSENRSEQELQIACSAIEAKLGKIIRDLSRCLSSVDGDKEKEPTRFCVISLKDSATAVRSCLQNVTLSSSVFLIRIELMAISSTDDKDYSVGLESSVILYNFGIAFRCMASGAHSMSDNSAVRAFNLLQLSISTLDTWYDQSDDVLMTEHLPVTILILQRLVLITAKLQMESESQRYVCRLKRLQNKFVKADAVHFYMVHSSARAA
jgi:hypothetical protein